MVVHAAMRHPVLASAECIAQHAVHVRVAEGAIDRAADEILANMQDQTYSTETWSAHPLNPKEKSKETVDW